MTMETRDPIAFHEAHRDKLLDHAALMLEDDDRLQASEKIWGAVSHAITAIAKKRNWPHSAYADKRDIARYIAEQANSPNINILYDAVYPYHTNFHEDIRDAADIGEGIRRAKEFVELLSAADAALSVGQRAPHGRAYREYERRHKIEPDPPYSAEEWRRHIGRLESQLARARAQAAAALSEEEPSKASDPA